MKRVVVLTGNYSPEYTGIAPHAAEFSQELALKGFKLNVFTSFPYYPDWKFDDSYKNKFFLTEKRNGCFIRRNSFFLKTGNVSTSTRLIAETSFVFLQIVNLLRHFVVVLRADVVVVFSPFFLQGLSALFLRIFFRVPYIFHVEDIQPDSAIDTGQFSKGIFARFSIQFAKFLEKLFYKHAFALSTLTKGMQNNLINKLDSKKKDIVLFGYWVDTKEFCRSEKYRSAFRQKFGYKEEDLIICYAGNIGRKQNLDKLLNLIPLFEKKNIPIKFIIAGEGAYKSELLELINKNPTKNLSVLPLQKGLDYIQLLNGIDLSLISQDDNANNIFIPSKIYKTMSCGSIIVCFANSESELFKMVEQSSSGFVFEWNQQDKFVEKMINLVSNKSELEKMRECGINYAKMNFGKRGCFKPILEILMKVK